MFIPPMNIKVIDHRHFGRKPVVGVYSIRNLWRYKVDRNKKENMILKSSESIIDTVKYDLS